MFLDSVHTDATVFMCGAVNDGMFANTADAHPQFELLCFACHSHSVLRRWLFTLLLSLLKSPTSPSSFALHALRFYYDSWRSQLYSQQQTQLVA